MMEDVDARAKKWLFASRFFKYTGMASCIVIHPWLDFPLDRCPVGNVVDMSEEDEFSEMDEIPSSASLDAMPLLSPSAMPLMDAHMHARLWQPFSTLLLTPTH